MVEGGGGRRGGREGYGGGGELNAQYEAWTIVLKVGQAC